MPPFPQPPPPTGWHLGPADIHVWTIPLDVAADELGALARVLSASEWDTAQGRREERHGNRFIAGRGFVRTLLGRYLQANPAELEFATAAHGKPFLSGALRNSGLNFNLTHSEQLALFAVTRVGPVGVDVERVRPVSDAESIAAGFFSARESGAFHQLPPEQKTAAFFNLWTRKEAWLKATGEGIGRRLNAVEVSFLPGEPARFLGLPDAPTAASWLLHHFDPAPGFVAALAVFDPGAAGALLWFGSRRREGDDGGGDFAAGEPFPRFSSFTLMG